MVVNINKFKNKLAYMRWPQRDPMAQRLNKYKKTEHLLVPDKKVLEMILWILMKCEKKPNKISVTRDESDG